MAQDRLSDPGLFPRAVLLDTVAHCNLFCSMCSFRRMTRPRGYMPGGLFRRAVTEIAAISPDTRVWMVFFGEALIRRDIFNLILYAKAAGLQDVVLNSNGTLLSPINRQKLILSGLDSLYVGLDAIRPDTYRKLRVGANYERTYAQVEAMIREAKDAGHPKVYVQFVVMEENESEREEFTAYWLVRGAEVKVRPKVSWLGTIPTYNAPALARYPCHWAMQTLSILWDGRVASCACDFDGRGIWGDANTQTLSEIWHAMKPFRDMHAEGRYDELPEFCRDCPDWQQARAEFISQEAQCSSV